MAVFSIPTTESQSFPKRLSLNPGRIPQTQPTKQEESYAPSAHPRRFNYFDQELLKAAAEQIPGNFMISPASIKSTLAMLLEAAEGRAASELRQALRLPEDVNSARELFKNFLTTSNVSLWLVLKFKHLLIIIITMQFPHQCPHIQLRFCVDFSTVMLSINFWVGVTLRLFLVVD